MKHIVLLFLQERNILHLIYYWSNKANLREDNSQHKKNSESAEKISTKHEYE